MPEFHLTAYGRRLFDNQLPTLIKHLGSIAEEMKRANDLKSGKIIKRKPYKEITTLADAINEIAKLDYHLAQVFEVLLNDEK